MEAGAGPNPPGGPPRADLSSWDARRRPASTLVAVADDTVVGFTDLLPDGLVDMLFVHPRTGGGRIARALRESERSTHVRASRVHSPHRSPGQHRPRGRRAQR